MSAPTLWEEGRMSASRTIWLCALACLLVVAVDLAITHRIGLLFDLGFVAVCLGAALAVRPRDFYTVAVLPPVLLLVVSALLALFQRTAVARPGDGFVQGLVSGLVRHAVALAAGYALCLGVLAVRHRVIRRRLGPGVASEATPGRHPATRTSPGRRRRT